MPQAVVILGAGSSADFGVPVLPGIFKDNHARSYLKQNTQLLQMLENVFWNPRGHDLESSDQSLTVEEMLTILRDWERQGTLPDGLTTQDILAFRRGLYVLIQRAVFEGKDTRKEHLNPLIGICREKFEHTTWASFNWDCVFESSFWYSQPWGGPGSRTNPSLAVNMANWYQGTGRHLFLKLHGAINWWLINGTLTYLQWAAGGELATKWAEYDRNPSIQDSPVILEPSFYKYEDEAYGLLAPQWHAFLAGMLKADYIMTIGYSLPEADSLARAKILTAFQTNIHSRWLLVAPPGSACERYNRLLGNRRLTVFPMTLAGFNNDIRTNLQQAFPEIDFSQPTPPPVATVEAKPSK